MVVGIVVFQHTRLYFVRLICSFCLRNNSPEVHRGSAKFRFRCSGVESNLDERSRKTSPECVNDSIPEPYAANTTCAHLSSCGGEPLGCPALPLAFAALDLLPGFLVDADDVVVGEDLAVDDGLFGQGLSLLELGPHPGLFVGPLLLSRLIIERGGICAKRNKHRKNNSSSSSPRSRIKTRKSGLDVGKTLDGLACIWLCLSNRWNILEGA